MSHPTVDTSPTSVCAVIVSYNGGATTVATIGALLPQVGEVVVVDNGSDLDSIQVLEQLHNSHVIKIIRLNFNSGIATALNLGIKEALKTGYTWVLTMDQDSLAAPDMVSNLLAFAKSVHDPRAVSFSPFIALQEANIGNPGNAQLSYAITSGNLVNTRVYSSVGLLDESLFIDSVDFEFSLRLRKFGYTLHRVGTAKLYHNLGNMEAAAIPFGFIKTSVHSPLRRYYIARNHFFILKKYFFHFPGFFIKKTILFIIMILKIIFIEKNKIKNLHMILKGLLDYFYDRTGRYE